MPPMSMRERILAIVAGREMDRVPFIMYDGILRPDDARTWLGPGRIGFMRWCRVHTVETPHCQVEAHEYFVEGRKWLRNTLHTSAGCIYEERAFETAYGSSSIRKHYVQEARDYEVLWAYLNDAVILENHLQFHKDQAALGEEGTPLVAVERSPYQQLWVQWVGIDMLGYHMADWPERVQHTVDLLRQRARRICEIAAASPATFVDFPDNITAPTIGLRRFQEYCVPAYRELAEMLAPRQARVFVHMDGDLKPLWQAIGISGVGGIDSLAPSPDNDTSVAQAVAMWPDMRLFVNFPSSVHLRPWKQVRAEAENILAAAGHTGHLQMQISENVPLGAWRTSFSAIAEAVEAFGKP